MIPLIDVVTALAPVVAPAHDVERLVTAATATLGRELGRHLGPPLMTMERHHGGRPAILLYDEPVIEEDDGGDEVGQSSAESAAQEAIFQVETRAYPTDPWQVIPSTDYVVEGRALRHADCWPRGISNIRVTYTRGFRVGEGPAELQDVVLQMVLGRLKLRGREGVQSETIGDYSYTKADMTALDSWTSIAARWRRVRV